MVEWVDRAIAGPRVADEAMVRAAERALRVRFPADYLAVARAHQGARPVPSAFDLPGGFVTAVSHLLHFEEAPLASNIIAHLFPFEGVLKKGWIPFASEIGGDVICFDFRSNHDHPPVLYWSVDTGAVPLADGFTSFLALLHA